MHKYNAIYLVVSSIDIYSAIYYNNIIRNTQTKQKSRRYKDMTVAEKKAKELISKQPLNELLTQWELTSIVNDENIPTVRGWLMEELEKRNPEAFDKWLESDAEDETLREYMTA